MTSNPETGNIRLRRVAKKVTGEATSDGAGVRLNRLMGTGHLNMLDPFLLLDEFRSDDKNDYIAGFPDHPHRGFETVTYMLAGRIRHRDNAGHEGVIEAGDVQWMTAASGIIHSEMPEQENGLMWGFQLWINLPAAEKMQAPDYQEYTAGRIPLDNSADGVSIHVIAGTSAGGVTGPVTGKTTQPLFLDIELAAGSGYTTSISSEANAFVYVYQGEVNVPDKNDGQTVTAGTLAVLKDGNTVRLVAGQSARCLLLAANPINEPVARGGPFVMNTREEIIQAFEDFNNGRF